MIFPPWAVRGRAGAWTRAKITALARLQRRMVGLGYDDVQLLGTAVPELAPLSGLTFGAIAARLGTSPASAELEIARRARLAGIVAIHAFSGDAAHDARCASCWGTRAPR
jgi:N-acyl-D-aspartate/D-glutamate deacylase